MFMQTASIKKLSSETWKNVTLSTSTLIIYKKTHFFLYQETSYNLRSVNIKKYQLLLLLQFHQASCGFYNRD